MAELTGVGSDAGSGNGLSGGLSGSDALGLGGLAAGGAGLGYLLSQGPAPLPQPFQQLEANVPGMEAEASTLESTGAGFAGQGAQALQQAQSGILTAPQQAQLTQYTQGLDNTAAQTFASMGRNINQDTSGIAAKADIDAKVNAMAQQEIQSTIALGLGETNAGLSYSGQGLQFQSAANQALITAGQAQMTADQNYSTALTGAFKAIGSIAGPLLAAAA